MHQAAPPGEPTLLRIEADPLPWAMMLVVALVLSASAGGLNDASVKAPEAAAVRATLLGAREDCVRDARIGGCDSHQATSSRLLLSAASFEPGSAELPEALIRPLRVIGEALRDERAVVRVEVHTDASGGEEAARTLSQRRAEAIRAFLVSVGVDPYRVLAAGMGASRPIVPSNPLAPGNRRVEIVRL
jgi:outer membrane protein OmpA-like peptidoglycan-associated protein